MVEMSSLARSMHDGGCLSSREERYYCSIHERKRYGLCILANNR
jgi:hypothetical protein